MRKLLVLLLVAAVIAASAAMLLHYSQRSSRGPLIVFCAGSLTVPLKKLASMFEERYGIPVYIEPAGSVMTVRKVVDLGRRADVVAVADYRLIPMYMFKRGLADWVLVFASNRLVLAYRCDAPLHELLRNGTWSYLTVLASGRVRWGFSNPNDDPCGYRSIGSLALAALLLRNESLAGRLLVGSWRGVTVNFTDWSRVDVYVYPNFAPSKSNVVTRSKEVDLVALLKTGALDYAFEYQSVAVQHHLCYAVLPREVNLGDPSMSSTYSKAVVHINVGTPAERAIKLAPILYGLTVPRNAPHPELAKLFVKFLLEAGPRVFNESGQPFLSHPWVAGEAPEWLSSLLGGAS